MFYRFCTAAISAMVAWSVNAQEVKIAEIVAIWKETPIREIHVEFESQLTETKLTAKALPKLPISSTSQTEVHETIEKVGFWRNAPIGMRRSSSQQECNWLRGKGISVDRVSLQKEGIYGVVTESEKEAAIFSRHEVHLILAWLDPRASSMFAGWKMEDANLRTFQEPTIGTVVQIEIDGERTLEMVLAKKFAWRPIELREFLGNKLVAQSEWSYRIDPEGSLELSDAKFSSFRGTSTLEQRLSIQSIHRECWEDSLSISLSGEYVLFENSGKGQTYAVLEDGSKRELTNEIRRGRKTWKEIFAWARENSLNKDSK